jgi:FMN phosphatase YigB (HAD superfamily)
VLFDVDDTLVDHGGAQESAIRDHLSSLGLPHDDAAVQRWPSTCSRPHDLAVGIVTNIDAEYQRRKLAAVGPDARDAGLRAVWLDRHGRTGGHRDDDGEPAHEVPEGIARVTSLDELDRLLA